MKTEQGVSCLIPFYNEGERIFSVLEEVTQVPSIDQIICVDDGSNDTAYQEIKEKWPHLAVIRQDENGGKTAAIKRGLQEVRHPYVLLMDADLQNVRWSELERIIDTIRHNPGVDMVILRRLYAEWFVKMNRGDVLLSGERIMRRGDLEAVLELPIEGFQLEMAINEYMWENGKRVRWVPWSATNTYKMEKRGRVEGFVHDCRMYADILRYIGLRSFFRQITTFARKPLPMRRGQQIYAAYQTASAGRRAAG